jgi:hypothetical protein
LIISILAVANSFPDDASVSRILKGFASTSPQLPLLQTQAMSTAPPPNPAQVIRAKFDAVERRVEDEPQMAPSSVTPAGLGLVRQRAMAGDKFIL